MNRFLGRCTLLALVCSIPLVAVQAGWLDWLTKKDTNTTTAATAPTVAAALSQEEIVRGLKEALSKGTQHAIAQLGQPSGFLTNLQVRIPMPETKPMGSHPHILHLSCLPGLVLVVLRHGPSHAHRPGQWLVPRHRTG